jgi:hypothetical protein
VHRVPDLHNWTTDKLAEAFRVADFFAKGDGAHEDDLLAEDGDFEDVACGRANFSNGDDFN